MKSQRKLLALLLTVLVIAASLPMSASASAADGFIVNDSSILIDYKGPGGNVTIPSYVTGIDDYVFRDDKTITGVTVVSHAKHIGRHAFDGCINLKTASISSESIGYAAFLDCKNLTTLTLGSQVRALDEYAFSNCEKLTAVAIPEGITTIPNNCFYGNSSLATVTFPKTLKAIGSNAFLGIAAKEVYFYPGLETIKDSAFALTDSLTDIWIPETVSEIGYHAFSHTNSITPVVHGVAGSYAERVFKNNSKYTFVPDYYGGDYDPGDPGEIGLCKDVKYDNTQGSAIVNSDGTISIYPAEGYRVKSITVNGKEIEFTTDVSGWTIISGICTTDKVVITFDRLGEIGKCKDVKYDDQKGIVNVGDDGTISICPTSPNDVLSITVNGKPISFTRNYGWVELKNIRTTDKVVVEFGIPAPVTFTDVPSGSYYAKAVDWAVENKITSGTGKNTFSPNNPCTRAEAVTFLWRAAGSPEPTGDATFSDVKPGSYYDKAVRWAVEHNITSGVGGGRFDPNGKCTRGQIVTFLWRFHGGAEQVPTITFKDVKKGAYYYNAVLWAAKHDITSGVGGGRFDPDGKCTRSQIVTFLYRDPFSFTC